MSVKLFTQYLLNIHLLKKYIEYEEQKYVLVELFHCRKCVSNIWIVHIILFSILLYYLVWNRSTVENVQFYYII